MTIQKQTCVCIWTSKVRKYIFSVDFKKGEFLLALSGSLYITHCQSQSAKKDMENTTYNPTITNQSGPVFIHPTFKEYYTRLRQSHKILEFCLIEILQQSMEYCNLWIDGWICTMLHSLIYIPVKGSFRGEWPPWHCIALLLLSICSCGGDFQ